MAEISSRIKIVFYCDIIGQKICTKRVFPKHCTTPKHSLAERRKIPPFLFFNICSENYDKKITPAVGSRARLNQTQAEKHCFISNFNKPNKQNVYEINSCNKFNFPYF